jgi:pimeloyl-ACP methyl ester carboxylesterase
MFQNKYPIAYEVARLSVSPEDIENEMMTMEDDDEEVPILLLNGFGVGSFHQHRLMRQLLLQHEEYCQQQQQQQQQQIDHETQQHQQLQQPQQSQQQQRPRRQRLVVYGIDYLGQGNSWPITCNGVGTSEDELNLGYSADVWLDQLKDFIDEVVLSSSSSSSSSSSLTASSLPSAATETFPSSSSSSSNPNQKKVHLIGNSVGGYLATILTHRHPHSISSLTLLNATPVWGLNLPGWDGRLPPPPLPKYVGGQMFDLIRNPNVINMYLQTAYVHPEAYDGTYEDCFYGSDGWKEDDTSNSDRRIALGEKIRACTEGKGGHAAFASILWSAPASEWIDDGTRCATPVDFYSTLQNVPVDVLLLFGANDSWCTPAIAKRMHTTLSQRNGESTTTNDGRDLVPLANRYVSLENVGHCPNHEAPTSVAKVVLPWIRAPSSSSSATANVNGEQQQQNRCNVPLVVPDGSDETQEPWGAVRAYEVSLDESKELGVMDRIVSSMVG